MNNVWWTRLNAALGSLVVTLGFWLVWGELPPTAAVLLGIAVAAFLAWQSGTIGAIWAWATLFLGLESLAWVASCASHIGDHCLPRQLMRAFNCADARRALFEDDRDYAACGV